MGPIGVNATMKIFVYMGWKRDGWMRWMERWMREGWSGGWMDEVDEKMDEGRMEW